MWWTSPLWRPGMRRTALYRAMRWRPVCGWSCSGFPWLRARRRISGFPRIRPVDRTRSRIWSRTGIGSVAWVGPRGGLLWPWRGLGTCGWLLGTRRAVSAWPGCRSRCWPGRRLRAVVLRFWLILRMQCVWQHCGETTEEEAVQQPGRPCFHCHYSLSGIWRTSKAYADPGGNAKAGARSDGLGCSILATRSCRSE
jgi:hypothetical protein